MNIQDEIAKQVMRKAMSKIDIDKLAAAVAPNLAKSICKGIIRAAAEIEWNDYLYDCLPAKEIEATLKKRLTAALKHL